MKNKYLYIFLGGLLTLMGAGAVLAVRFGLFSLPNIINNPGFFIFAAAAVLFYFIYFLHGLRKWGWLFPALFSSALVVIIAMEESGMGGIFTPILLFTAWALPFIVGYFVSRRRWLLVPGIFLVLFAGFILFASLGTAQWSGVAFFVMLVAGLLTAYFLLERQWWLLLLAGGCASLGTVVFLETRFPYAPLPFIPGIPLRLGLYTWVLVLGLALTFSLLWLLRGKQPTSWAVYPALALLALSVLDFLFGGLLKLIGVSVAFFLVGLLLLLSLLDPGLSRHVNAEKQV